MIKQKECRAQEGRIQEEIEFIVPDVSIVFLERISNFFKSLRNRKTEILANLWKNKRLFQKENILRKQYGIFHILF